MGVEVSDRRSSWHRCSSGLCTCFQCIQHLPMCKQFGLDVVDGATALWALCAAGGLVCAASVPLYACDWRTRQFSCAHPTQPPPAVWFRRVVTVDWTQLGSTMRNPQEERSMYVLIVCCSILAIYSFKIMVSWLQLTSKVGIFIFVYFMLYSGYVYLSLVFHVNSLKSNASTMGSKQTSVKQVYNYHWQ